MEPSIETVKVDPELAAIALSFNTRNRLPNPGAIEGYARDMTAGNWGPWSVLSFAEDGTLLDGQNRLHAVIRSGATVEFVVMKGLPKDAFDRMDQGRKRTLGQTLRLRGEKNHAQIAASINTYWQWERGLLGQPLGRPTQSEAINWLDHNPDIRDAVRAAMPLAGRPVLAPMSVMGPLLFVIGRYDLLERDAFAQSLREGTGLEAHDGAFRLREFFIGSHRPGRGVSVQFMLAHAIKGWNHWITGEPAKVLRWSRGGRNREAFPELVGRDGEQLIAVIPSAVET